VGAFIAVDGKPYVLGPASFIFTNTINFSTELPLAQGIQFGTTDEGSATA
jgi:hypothetical protein